MRGRARKPLLERFEVFLPTQLRDGECWEWQGSRNRDGYGQIKAGSGSDRVLKAHRVAWEAHHAEPIPVGLQVCHHCDNPACVNPAHLFLGTSGDNAADRDAKGRRTAPKGEAHSNSRLTEAQVLEIRSLYAAGVGTQVELALQFNVLESRISAIISRKTWRHLPGKVPAKQRVRGETHSQARFTETQVLEMRRLYAAGSATQRQIAARFNANQRTVSDIVLRKRWRHLP
jgi:hypothetical protein